MEGSGGKREWRGKYAAREKRRKKGNKGLRGMGVGGVNTMGLMIEHEVE